MNGCRPFQLNHSERLNASSLRVSAVARLARVTFLFIVWTASCGPSQVVRIRAGQSYEERLIESRAYAAFMRARISEAKGDPSRATVQYGEVLSYDPQAVEAWVRIGSINCLNDPTKALDAWQKAERLDAQSPELWLQRARCEYRLGHLEIALNYARLTVRFEPTSAQAAVLIADASLRLNRREEAITWLLGATAMSPTNVYLWKTIFLSKSVPSVERRYAALQLAQLRPLDASAIPFAYSMESGDTPVRAAGRIKLELMLEAALRKSDTAESQHIATLLGLNPERLALRALIEGAYNVVLDEVELLLAVDSDNASAWIVGLVAADRSRDDARFNSLLARCPKASVLSNDRYRDLLVELVGNRATLDAVNSSLGK